MTFSCTFTGTVGDEETFDVVSATLSQALTQLQERGVDVGASMVGTRPSGETVSLSLPDAEALERVTAPEAEVVGDVHEAPPDGS